LILLPELPEVPGTDKTHHFIAYASIAFPISFKSPRYLWKFLFAVLLWSATIELIQPYVNRYGEWLDLLANASGLLIGFVVASIFRKLLH